MGNAAAKERALEASRQNQRRWKDQREKRLADEQDRNQQRGFIIL